VVFNGLDRQSTNILLGYHLLKYSRDLGSCRYVPFQLEQLAAEGGWYSENVRTLLENAADVWDYSPDNVSFLATSGVRAKLLTIGYHERI